MSYTSGFSLYLQSEKFAISTISNLFRTNASNENIRNSGDHSVGVPPLPIPNREVKPNRADGTAFSCGRVGHRHFYLRVPSVQRAEGTFFCLRRAENMPISSFLKSLLFSSVNFFFFLQPFVFFSCLTSGNASAIDNEFYWCPVNVLNLSIRICNADVMNISI